MPCGELEVFMASLAVGALVFDANVGKLHATVRHRKAVGCRPLANLLWGPIRSSRRLPPAAVVFLEEPLILLLQLVVEDHPTNVVPLSVEPLRSSFVGAVQLRVVGHLARLDQAGVVPLPGHGVVALVMLKDASSLLGERQKLRPLT
jgi:hypothetical protein